MSREDSSAALSITFGIGASNEVVRVSSHTHRLSTDSGDIDGSIANQLGSTNNSIGSINTSNDTEWIAISCEQDTCCIIGQESRIIHQSRTDNSEVDVYGSPLPYFGSPLIDSGSISSMVYQMNSIIHKPYGIINHQLSIVKEGVHVNTDPLEDIDGDGSPQTCGSCQQSYATMVDDSICSSDSDQISWHYQQLYVGFYIRIEVNSVWGSRSNYNKDMIADVFRRSLNGKGYELDMTEWSKVKSSSSNSLVGSNVGVLFESEGAVLVSFVPTPIRLPSLIVIEVCLEREYSLEREHRHTYVLDEMSCALELKSRCLILKMTLKKTLKMILKICHVPEGVYIPFRSWNMFTRQEDSIIFPSLPPLFRPRRPPLSIQYCLDLVLRVRWRIIQMGLCIIREGEVEVVYMPLSKDTQWLR